MSYTLRLAGIFLCALVCIIWLDQYRGPPAPRNLYKPRPDEGKLANIAAPSDLWVAESGELMQSRLIQAILDTGVGQAAPFLLHSPRARSVSMSAMADDFAQHLVHDYLVGYQPFETDELWVPWYTLSQKKTYEFDHLQYGQQDLWQTSRQAFYFTRGDCEDHAIALADWLIEMGYDARVALGRYGNEGHAWVVLFLDGEQYLLEATRKNYRRGFSAYPLARFQAGYFPQFMFNRDGFWVNTGSPLTTDYESGWVRKSEYRRRRL